jgi:hypothetical protein
MSITDVQRRLFTIDEVAEQLGVTRRSAASTPLRSKPSSSSFLSESFLREGLDHLARLGAELDVHHRVRRDSLDHCPSLRADLELNRK